MSQLLSVLIEIRDSLKRLEEMNQIKIVKKRDRKSKGLTEFQEKYCLPLYENFPFPRSRGRAIPAIEAAYKDSELQKLTGNNPDDIMESLMRDVLKYREWIERNGKTEQYTQHPASWFNAQRYLE